MKYAIFSNNGKQYKAEEGQELLLDHLPVGSEIRVKDATNVDFTDVLLVVDNKKIELGEPTVKGAKVSVEIVGDEKGDKISIVKFKSKSRYRRKTGFRHQYTRVKIAKISL